MARKSRKVYDITRSYQTWFNGSPSQSGVTRVSGYQVTDSTNNPVAKLISRGENLGNNARKFKRNMDLGGYFFTFKPYAKHVLDWSGSANNGLRSLGGTIVAADPPDYSDLSKIGLTPLQRAAMISKGTTAIKRTSPLNPVVDGVTALAELRKDGLPKLPGVELLDKGVKRPVKTVANEHLNAQFALLPLVSDVKNLAKAVSQSDRIIGQLYADSGKRIRRRYEFPLETDTTVETKTGLLAVPAPALPTQWYPNVGAITKTTTTTTTRRYWFSAAFTYCLPSRDDLTSRSQRLAAEAKRLYGIRISPEVAWNLTPWSWAVDWVSNTGDVIANASSFSQDGLVMPYGYVMCETHVDVTVDVHCPIVGVSQDRFITNYGYHTKARERATPYGFGLNLDAFTPRQWSILGALALTKAPGKLP